MMPNMDGIEMCEKIRSNKDFDSVLILFFRLSKYCIGSILLIIKPINQN